MAIPAVSSVRRFYAAPVRPAPTPVDEVMGAAPTASADDALRRRGVGETEPNPVPSPYLNTRGETTGTAINITA